MLSILAALGVGLVGTPHAWSQDAPPKAEPPKESAPVPAPPEFPKESAPVPAPPEFPKESAPVPAPRDEQTESSPVSSEALSVRYRFSEKYSPDEDPNKPELVTQYRVGVLDTLKEVSEKAQGAPDVRQTSQQTIYTERAAKVGPVGEMTDAVRRYDTVRTKAMAPRPPLNPPFLQGLEIWYHRRPGERPEIMSLSSNRPLSEAEYNEISHEPFVPQLTAFFKNVPRRVGDTWAIPPPVAKLVWGELPEANDYELTGSLIEVRKAARGTSLRAVIGVSGRFILDGAPNAFNARIDFTFDPAQAVAPSAGSGASLKPADSGTKTGARKRDEGIIDARGWISQAVMAQSRVTLIPDTDDRLKQTSTRELRLERRSATTRNAPADGSSPTLTIPNPPPTANEANSWLVYDDPMGRFHFRHPQELELNSFDPSHVVLVETNPKGHTILGIDLQPKGSDPARDRQNRDPDYHRSKLRSTWEKDKKDVVSGSTGWLPDADWSPLKRKVYRIEAALKPKGQEAGNAQRLYLDYYLVLFTSNESVVVTAMTEQDSNLKLRDQSEKLIKSFEFGRAGEQAKANPVTPSPSSPPSRRPPPPP